MVLDVVRRDVSNIERFCGHPALLTLVHPLEENAYVSFLSLYFLVHLTLQWKKLPDNLTSLDRGMLS